LVKARAAAARALAEADQKREVVQLLQDGLRFAQPGTGYRADMAVREMLDAVAQRIGETSDPRVRASLLTTIGTAYASLGLFDPALKFLEDARRIRTSLPEPSAADLAESNIELAALYWYRNEAALALDHARAGMRYTEQAFGRDDERYANARNNLGIMLANSGQTEPGLEHLRAALLLRDRILGPVHKWTIQTRLNIGSVLLNARRLDEAAQWLEPALADATAHLPLEEEVRQQATDLLAEYYTASGRSAESVALLEQVVADYRALFGPEHFKLIRPLTALASALKAEQRLDDAVARLHEAQQIGSSRLGDESPETLSVLNDLGLVYESSGRLADAAAVHERVLDARRRVLPPTHFQIAQSASNLAVVRYLSGDPAGALALLRESLPILEREFGSDSPHARLCRQRIARCAERMQPPQGPGAQTEP
jgi:tetratricopeptide (TPR) repeat protein